MVIGSPYSFDVVVDLCEKRQQISHLPQTTLLYLQFNKSYLSYPHESSESSRYSDGSFMVSLDRLMDGDFLRGSVGFNANDKTILSLSLATALLHMLGGTWLQQRWTAKNIQFLSNSEKLLDLYRPFITCAVEKSEHAKKRLDSSTDSLESIMLSFAQLILEIEIGERISVVAASTPRNMETTILSVLKQRNRDNAGGAYTFAVMGCLTFLEPQDRPLEDVANSDDARLQRIRSDFYQFVIKPLEASFALIPEVSMSLKSRTMPLNRVLLDPSLDHALYGTGALDDRLRTVPAASMETLPGIIIEGDEPTNTAAYVLFEPLPSVHASKSILNYSQDARKHEIFQGLLEESRGVSESHHCPQDAKEYRRTEPH